MEKLKFDSTHNSADEFRLTAQIKFREELSPRRDRAPDPGVVQEYADNLENLPVIQINQHDEIIDGRHRWLAYQTNGVEQIPVEVIETCSDDEVFRLAIQANNNHGLPLSEIDRKMAAIRLYAMGAGSDKKEIAQVLSVSERMVRSYLTDVDKQLRGEQKQQIFDLYMDCWTQQEIAKRMGMAQKSVSRIIESFSHNGTASDLTESIDFNRDPDFKPPLYNVWNFGDLTNEVKHFGNSEQKIVENLLSLYTDPFDIVVDPFAGGGSTLDVCRKRLRRCYASDRKPIPARANQIRQLDVVESLPHLGNRWADVSLTYLDPPYWRQAEGEYSTDDEDLSNMDLAQFTASLAGVIRNIAQKQSKGVIALLIRPTQWLSEGRKVVDHVFDLISVVDLEVINRVSCPSKGVMATPPMIEWAKANKELLVLTRELIIWQV